MPKLEKDIESKLIKEFHRRFPNGLIKKLSGRHWPDRMLLVNGEVFFVELKRPGGQLSPGQKILIKQLIDRGYNCLASTSVDEILGFVYDYFKTRGE